MRAWICDWLKPYIAELPPNIDPTFVGSNPAGWTDRDEVEIFVVGPGPDPAHLAVLKEMRSLRLVQAVSAGVDPFLGRLPASVTLCDAAGAHDAAVAEWVVGALLWDCRRFGAAVMQQLRKEWRAIEVGDLAEQTVVIVGYGSIGQAVEERLSAFGPRILRIARNPRFGVGGKEELDQVLPSADSVVLLVPLTAETQGLFDRRRLRLLKDGALLINASRGTVVDKDALVSELKSGRLRAALDVVDPEPLPEAAALWTVSQIDSLLITPHNGGESHARPRRVAQLVSAQLARVAAGREPINVVKEGY